MSFIASLKSPALSHSVYGQSIVNRLTGQVDQRIVIHRNPHVSFLSFREKQLPKSFGGFPVVELDWPSEDL